VKKLIERRNKANMDNSCPSHGSQYARGQEFDGAGSSILNSNTMGATGQV
jgi:hypothetical protein